MIKSSGRVTWSLDLFPALHQQILKVNFGAYIHLSFISYSLGYKYTLDLVGGKNYRLWKQIWKLLILQNLFKLPLMVSNLPDMIH